MKNVFQKDEGPARLFSLGSINADFQVRVERRPDISETLMATQFVRLGGGKSANVAYLACKLGVSTQLFAHTGDDDLCEQAVRPLRESGVDLSQIKKMAGQDTGFTMITVPPDGKKGIIMAANANESWSDEDAADVVQAIRNGPPGSVLVVNCEIPVFVVERAAQAARERGFKVILDPSPADRVTGRLLELADMITPNPGEAEQLTGIECKDVSSALRAGRKLRERGIEVACVKLGDGGCVAVGPAQHFHVAATPVEVVDTTGAGDAFAGALAVAVLERQDLVAAMRFACAASHLAVKAYGSQPAYPSRDQINQMEKHIRIDHDAASA